MAEKEQHHEECWYPQFPCECRNLYGRDAAWEEEPPDMADRENGFIN